MKKIAFLFLSLLLLSSLSSLIHATDEYRAISTVIELQNINNDPGGKYYLANDIDC